ncbi:hypothetical protein MLD63_14695 [Paracoccus sp. TK19116]|uniref:Uncharacterized protein n=1 Tax=Paracoccus albicereus TaxID=2922394 RepID=A0ABT1MTL8_9RHOB|nr:hypothetical protein [Paracoccus albicereus]MCQ0971669.1 hypothetical protein [Paracoccus albicereus]
MTALTEYERLEAAGSWREGPGERLREVIVSVGDATLILTDPKSDTPLSHWSLPAVIRLNPGESPALFAPQADGAGDDEVLEIDDAVMVDAIERVHRAIESRRAHPGRLRGGLTLLAVVAMLAVAILWVPGALVRHAARIAPPAQSLQIGKMALADVMRSTGLACAHGQGPLVTDHLARRVLGEGATIVVLPADLNGARQLPGRIFAVGQDSLAGSASTESLAGELLAAGIVAGETDPVYGALDYAGFRPVMSLLTGGDLPAGSLDGYGQILLSQPVQRAADSSLLSAFTEVGISSVPYARRLDPSGEATLGLIEADPFRTTNPPAPLLSDEQWQALTQICETS